MKTEIVDFHGLKIRAFVVSGELKWMPGPKDGEVIRGPGYTIQRIPGWPGNQPKPSDNVSHSKH